MYCTMYLFILQVLFVNPGLIQQFIDQQVTRINGIFGVITAFLLFMSFMQVAGVKLGQTLWKHSKQ